MSKGVRITVVRRYLHQDLIDELVEPKTTIACCPDGLRPVVLPSSESMSETATNPIQKGNHDR
jgi:hypothetical protein